MFPDEEREPLVKNIPEMSSDQHAAADEAEAKEDASDKDLLKARCLQIVFAIVRHAFR